MLDNKTSMYTDKVVKNWLKNHCRDLNVPMSEYLRCMLRLSMIEIGIEEISSDFKNAIEEANYIKEYLRRGKI